MFSQTFGLFFFYPFIFFSVQRNNWWHIWCTINRRRKDKLLFVRKFCGGAWRGKNPKCQKMADFTYFLPTAKSGRSRTSNNGGGGVLLYFPLVPSLLFALYMFHTIIPRKWYKPSLSGSQVYSQRWARLENFPCKFPFRYTQTNFSGFKK